MEFCERAPPYRIRAWTGRIDGKIVGIGGIGRQPDGIDIVFLDCLPEAREYPVAMCKLAKHVILEMHEMNLTTVYAEADEAIDASGRFLAYLGFEHLEGEVWIWRHS